MPDTGLGGLADTLRARRPGPRLLLENRARHGGSVAGALEIDHSGEAMPLDPRPFLRSLFDAAVAAADPARCVPRHLPDPPAGRTLVLGAGKAAAAMARAVDGRLPGDLTGLVVTRRGQAVPCGRIEVVEAAHPVPDAAGIDAARRILDLAAGAGPDDLVLFLLSGGASALLALPAPGVTLEDKQAVTRALLASGAAIGEINAVRKHLSAIKGGRLAAAAHPARVVTLAISDVVGDDPAVIGSGPTVADPSTLADAQGVLARYGIDPPAAVAERLAGDDETPKPGDPRLAATEYILCARPADALAAARQAATEAGVMAIDLGDAIEGEARDVGRTHAQAARRLAADGQVRKPLVILSGGEMTVTLGNDDGSDDDGAEGGPNTEYLLALALELGGAPGIWALAADTDGIDGKGDGAGALVAPDSLARAAAAGLDPEASLARNDAGGFFAALGDRLVTGPTGTNVNDFRAVLVTGENVAP